MSTEPGAPAAPPPEPDLFDYALVRNFAGFVLRGVRRHRTLSALTFVFIAGLGLAITALLPRTYRAETRLLASQNQVIRALGNPRSSLPSEEPIRAAREIIFAHDNLVSLMKQTNLLQHWEETRPPLLKLRDKLAQLIRGKPSDEDKVEALVGTLEKRLKVETDQQTVTISVEWPDAKTAYLLVDTALQNFLETRHVTEMTAISEALSILEMHASAAQKTVDDALHDLENVREQRRKGNTVALSPSPTPVETSAGTSPSPSAPETSGFAAAPAANEAELAQLKFLLNSKKRALADLEDFKSRRLSELNAQLQEQKVQYSELHPVVVDTQHRIDTMKLDSPQMVQVRGDIEQLTQEYKRKGGMSPDALVEPTRAARPPRRNPGQQAAVALSNADLADDPAVDYARNNLRVAAAKSEELMMRIDSARIEQDTARAAFKYRFSVVRPASVPKEPIKPDVLILVVLTLMVALGGAIAAGALRDASKGRYVESWQVERTLNMKVLAQVKGA
ncbi:MAG: hypothetical protein IPJ65_04665 [Archangiaceae bacterium]|nr:hypothetical protein [Archangiaceae bacterium]